MTDKELDRELATAMAELRGSRAVRAIGQAEHGETPTDSPTLLRELANVSRKPGYIVRLTQAESKRWEEDANWQAVFIERTRAETQRAACTSFGIVDEADTQVHAEFDIAFEAGE